MNRREFFQSAGAGAVVFKLAGRPPAMKAVGANDEIGLGFIGIGIRGDGLMRGFKAIPGVRPIIAADVYDGHLAHVKELLEGKIETTRDYKAVLERKDVDAVVIATPDHWHRHMTLEALAAGKHVYVEKPMTWSLQQGPEMIAAAKKSGKLVCVGSGAKSSTLTAKMKEIVKSGALGKVNMIRMANNRNTAEGAWVYPVPPDASPETIDWQRFLGPAPKKSFDPKVFFRWRCWWEYSGGVATDLFVHLLSTMHEFMDVKGPRSAASQGGIYRWDDGRTVPDIMETVYQYAEGFLADMYVNLGNSRSTLGTVVMGTEGTLVVEGFGKLTLYPEPVFQEAQRYAIACWPDALRKQYFESLGYTPEGRRKEPLPAPKPKQEIPIQRGLQHHELFIKALREGGQSPETAEEGHYAAGAAHLANLSYRKGRRMKWDLATNKVSEG